MRKGYTTGTAATAAAKAHAVFITTGTAPKNVDVTLPEGGVLNINISSCDLSGACVVKDAGDDPDVTHGTLICAVVLPMPEGGVVFIGGKGVGTVTKKGLTISVGEPAINPVPRKMITENLRQIGICNALVTISVPEGEKLAAETFNPRLGITGGISIIGTTGVVTPMSTEALTATIECEIDVLSENGATDFCLVPGKIGEKHIQSVRPETKTVMISNFAQHALSYMRSKGLTSVKLAGHPAKLAKIAMGYGNTHSKHSPPAQHFIADKLKLGKTYNTVEEICAEGVNMDLIAEMISQRIIYDYGFENADVVLFDMSGNIMGRHNG